MSGTTPGRRRFAIGVRMLLLLVLALGLWLGRQAHLAGLRSPRTLHISNSGRPTRGWSTWPG